MMNVTPRMTVKRGRFGRTTSVSSPQMSAVGRGIKGDGAVGGNVGGEGGGGEGGGCNGGGGEGGGGKGGGGKFGGIAGGGASGGSAGTGGRGRQRAQAVQFTSSSYGRRERSSAYRRSMPLFTAGSYDCVCEVGVECS